MSTIKNYTHKILDLSLIKAEPCETDKICFVILSS